MHFPGPGIANSGDPGTHFLHSAHAGKRLVGLVDTPFRTRNWILGDLEYTFGDAECSCANFHLDQLFVVGIVLWNRRGCMVGCGGQA